MAGKPHFVRLIVSLEEQERRIGEPGRAAYGKLTSLELLRSLRPQFEAAMERMPAPSIVIDASSIPPEQAARAIKDALGE
jgi:hypothetical protein